MEDGKTEKIFLEEQSMRKVLASRVGNGFIACAEPIEVLPTIHIRYIREQGWAKQKDVLSTLRFNAIKLASF